MRRNSPLRRRLSNSVTQTVERYSTNLKRLARRIPRVLPLIDGLFESRPSSMTSAGRTPLGLGQRRLMTEPLEERRLLSVTTSYVDDTLVWDVAHGGDMDSSGDLSINDIVIYAQGESGVTDNLIYGTNAFSSIQAAIAETDSGGTVNVAAGSYSENLVVNKQITLQGDGSDTTTYIDAGGGIGIDVAAGGTSETERLQIDGFHITNASNGIRFDAQVSHVTLSDMLVDASTYGIEVHNSGDVYDLVLDDVTSTQNNVGFRVATTGKVEKLAVENSHFDNNNIGFYINASSGSTTNEADFTDITVTNSTFNNNVQKGIYVEKLDHATFDGVMIDGNGNTYYTAWAAGMDVNLKYGDFEEIVIQNSSITDNGKGDFTNGVGMTIKARNQGGYAGNPATLDGVTVYGNIISDNWVGLRLGEPGANSTGLSNVNVTQNNLAGNLTTIALDNQSINEINATANWWGHISGPHETAGNQGGLGATLIRAAAAGVVDYSPWLIDGSEAAGEDSTLGFQRDLILDVYGSSEAGWGNVSLADNDFRRLANALGTAVDGMTIQLHGTFDWRDTANGGSDPNDYAATAWANGVDGVTGTDDYYTILAQPDAQNVTLTAPALGDATIQGPGDLESEVFEGFLTLWGDDYSGWEISNLEIFDFDTTIGMFYSGQNDFDNVSVLNNHIRMATDTIGAAGSDEEVWQNIAIHLGFGDHQTIQGNLIDVPGDGVSDSGNDIYAKSNVLQSNTSGGSLYEGLLIDDNTVQILNAQSADPEKIRGIWDNSHNHSANITVSNNTWTNLDPANDPALNRQEAFWITSHSSDTTTVTYSGNQVDGANIGIKWLGDPEYSGNDFSAHEAVEIDGNTLNNVNTGILVQSSGLANITGNTINGSATGILVSDGATATVTGNDFDSSTNDNATDLLIDTDAGTVTIAAGNQFAGDDYFIDNRTAQDIDLTSATSFDVSDPLRDDNFEIEDKMFHGPDNGSSGVITWVSGNLFVTEPGTGGNDESIQDAVDTATAGDTLTIENGLYTESNILVDKAMTIQGESRDGVTVAPAFADDNSDSTTGGVISNAFLIAHDTVTIKDLTIDGAANTALAGDHNFRHAIITDYGSGTYSELVADNLSIKNIYRKGIGLYSGDGHATGNQITNSSFDHVGDTSPAWEGTFAIAAFGADVQIIDNTITNSAAGVGTNYFDSAYKPQVTITGNSFSRHRLPPAACEPSVWTSAVWRQAARSAEQAHWPTRST